MADSTINNVFPDYFSKQVIQKIYDNGKNENIEVYRVNKYGDETKAFLNYYDEVVLGLKTIRKDKGKYLEKCKENIDQLSVSCYYEFEDIRDYYEITLKEYPQKTLLHGSTNSNYGLSQRTKERKSTCKDSHTDWWLYKDATPWKEFKEVQYE